jgi:hypothetical protein
MVGVHAALQWAVDTACEACNPPKAAYKLQELGAYKLAYEVFCTKGGGRAPRGDTSPHMSMTRDNYVFLCHLLLASDSTESIRDLAMVPYQFATVGRGDDVRPRSLADLVVRFVQAVGESRRQAVGDWVVCASCLLVVSCGASHAPR